MLSEIKVMAGLSPNATFMNKKEEIYMISYEGKHIGRIKCIGFRGY
jgi:hypothetical protein